ncbi:MAG TPA: DUF2147 domain-containing protein [Moheibacter sp.]|nr:DUF2147 domain-containing protein [Moheibacter sp.]
MKNVLTIGIILFYGMIAYAQSPVGTWKTVDDKSGKEKSHVKIYETKTGKLQGDVVKILTPGREDAKCTKCEGTNKDKPVKGMTLMWGLEKDGDEWIGGHIIDPSNGNQYKCEIRLKDKNTLEVRGYLGISLLGRTQTWTRVN